MIYRSIISSHAKTRKPAHSGRTAPRDARPVGPQDARARSGARPHHRVRHRASVRRRAAGGAWVAVSGAAPPRGSRLDRIVLGNVRKQPPCAVLPAHAGRTPAIARSDQPVGSHRARDQSRPAARLIKWLMAKWLMADG